MHCRDEENINQADTLDNTLRIKQKEKLITLS
jgi:hypothetical protein